MEYTYILKYKRLYTKHWWWRAREDIILDKIKDLVESMNDVNILDVGCGNGFFFDKLEKYGNTYGIETDVSMVSENSIWKHRIYHNPIIKGGTYTNKYQLVLALDVLEHVEDDVSLAQALVDALVPNGYLVVTVPAFMKLWDIHDDINHHYRRYTLKQLKSLFTSDNVILSARYLFPSLFLLKWCISQINKKTFLNLDQTKIPIEPLNFFLRQILLIEDNINKYINLPFGSTAMTIIKKSD